LRARPTVLSTARLVESVAQPDGHAQLRVARELAIEGVVVKPLIRNGGSGFDLRIRRAPPIKA
jgi:hypothetical protein